MVDFLDIRTLIFMVVLQCAVLGGSMFFFGSMHTRVSGLRWFGVGQLVIGLGCFLIGLRETAPLGISVILSNVLILAGTLVYQDGFARSLHQERIPVGISVFMLAMLAAVMFHLTYIDPNINQRVVLMSVLLALSYSFSAAHLLQGLQVGMAGPRLLVMVPLYGGTLFFFFRAAWCLGDAPMVAFLEGGMLHAMAFVVILLVLLLSSFGIIWITCLRLEKECREQARIDPLTGVLNRTAMNELAQREVARVSRHGHTLSVILMDLDSFREMNEKYGRDVGDTVLAHVADIIASRLRGQDIFARYAGETFVAILPDTEKDVASYVAEKLRISLHGFRMNHGLGDIGMTASFGVAALGEDAESWEKLMVNADKAMYTAKENGRNRVELA